MYQGRGKIKKIRRKSELRVYTQINDRRRKVPAIKLFFIFSLLFFFKHVEANLTEGEMHFGN